MNSVQLFFNLLSSAISRRKASQRSSDSSMISSSSSQSYQLKSCLSVIYSVMYIYYQTLKNLYEMVTSIFSAF